MHEAHLMADLMRKIESVAADQGGGRVAEVSVKLGALSHMTADHFREHFEDSARGTCAEGAALDIEVAADIDAPDAQGIVLKSLALEA